MKNIFVLMLALAMVLSFTACSGGFSIKGKWKNTGGQGYGQAEPGAIIVFDGSYCNFYSPRDTYSLEKDGNHYKLNITSLLGESDSFTVTVINKNNIEIGAGRTVKLTRVD